MLVCNNFEINLKTCLSSIWILNSNPIIIIQTKFSNTKYKFDYFNIVIPINILLLLIINPKILLLGF
jgi:hypothetical protein